MGLIGTRGGVCGRILGGLGIDRGLGHGGPIHPSRNGCLPAGDKRIISGSEVDRAFRRPHRDDLGATADDEGTGIRRIQSATPCDRGGLTPDDGAGFNRQHGGGLDEGQVVQDVNGVRGPALIAGDHGDAPREGSAALGDVPGDVVDVLEVDRVCGAGHQADRRKNGEKGFVHDWFFLDELVGDGWVPGFSCGGGHGGRSGPPCPAPKGWRRTARARPQ